MAAPESGPDFAVSLCNHFNFNSDCATMFSRLGIGAVITQVVANADVGGLDGQMLCQNFLSLCPLAPATPLNLTNWFAKPKPNPLPAPKKPSGKKLKVLHISDAHIDPRTSFSRLRDIKHFDNLLQATLMARRPVALVVFAAVPTIPTEIAQIKPCSPRLALAHTFGMSSMKLLCTRPYAQRTIWLAIPHTH